VIRPVSTSLIDMQNRGPNNYDTRQRRLDFSAEQDFGPLQLDYAANYARTRKPVKWFAFRNVRRFRRTRPGLWWNASALHPRLQPNSRRVDP